ncbi:hypothetical protein, partial [Pseudoalteromonas ruthenica]|uniref:hypothetical protein n=1 Tax=Pseudoalteromonas ruthenica TaxID=151081 RepID=UPI001BB11F65
RRHLTRENEFMLELKQGVGGMPDIEFITPFLGLAQCAPPSSMTRVFRYSQAFGSGGALWRSHRTADAAANTRVLPLSGL